MLGNWSKSRLVWDKDGVQAASIRDMNGFAVRWLRGAMNIEAGYVGSRRQTEDGDTPA